MSVAAVFSPAVLGQAFAAVVIAIGAERTAIKPIVRTALDKEVNCIVIELSKSL